MSILSVTKAPFVGYNRDLQWVKYIVNDVIFETKSVPGVMTGVVSTLMIHKDVMAGWTTHGFILAQAIMEGLIVAFNVPMRQAKIIVETAIKQVGPTGNLTRKIINLSLVQNKFSYKVTPDQFKEWTNPLMVAEKQMKKDLSKEII